MTEIVRWQDKLADFIDRALGRVAADAVGYFGGDRLSCARVKNIINLVNKTEERLAEKGVTRTRRMLLKHLHPVFEEASLEDDDDVHTLWARLLAEALDPNGVEVDRIYIGVLKEVRPKDAQLLKFMWEHRTISIGQTGDGRVHKVDVGHLIAFSPATLARVAGSDDRTIRHLHRIGLIKPHPVERDVLKPKTFSRGRRNEELFERGREKFFSDLDKVAFTEFGMEFCSTLIDVGAAPTRPVGGSTLVRAPA